MKTVVNLTASRFLGGPEWQMLGLAEHLVGWRPVFVSFAEDGHCQSLLDHAAARGFSAHRLSNDTPHLMAATKEVRSFLQGHAAQILICHGYKANLVGRLAARRLGIPVVSISHGWTGETRKVRVYEALDRRVIRWLDHVVCVSEGQAVKVRRAGVQPSRISVIHNAIRSDRFTSPDPSVRRGLEKLFAFPVKRIVAAAGRISPEKGFEVLLSAAKQLTERGEDVGFLWYGDGRLRDQAARQIETAGLNGRFVLAGFCDHLDILMPNFDVLAISSYSEGLPCVLLEAMGAGIPVVATAVGGIPEALDDGQSGYLVASGDSAALANRIADALRSESHRLALGEFGRNRARNDFTFETQQQRYQELFSKLVPNITARVSA